MEEEFIFDGLDMPFYKLKEYLTEWYGEELASATHVEDLRNFSRLCILKNPESGEVYYVGKLNTQDMVYENTNVSTAGILDLNLRTIVEACYRDEMEKAYRENLNTKGTQLGQ